MALVSQKRKSLNENFEKLLMKFSLKEVKEHVLFLFEDLTWNVIVKAVKKYNLSSRKEHISKLLGEYSKSLTIEDLREIYGNLLLLDVMLHPSRKTWTAVNMRIVDEIPDDEDCAKSIVKSFREDGRQVNVYTVRTEDIRWFVVIIYRKTKNSGIVYQNPIFFAQPKDTTVVFFSPKPTNTNLKTIKVIVSGLGYEDHKVMKLTGKNIHSLRLMMNRFKDAPKIRAETARALANIENRPVQSSRGMDFCQNKARAAQAKEMFGDESIELQTLTVNFDTEWRGVRTLPQAEGKSFCFSMQLKSKNVRKSLETMVEKGAIVEPYPIWAKEFLICGKNTINVA